MLYGETDLLKKHGICAVECCNEMQEMPRITSDTAAEFCFEMYNHCKLLYENVCWLKCALYKVTYESVTYT
jgi:hypothetical protein